MSMEIKKLTTELTEDYLHFFDVTPHSTNKAKHRCYCVCCAGEDCDGRNFSTAEKRRSIAEEYVKNGAMQGYLAYSDGRVAGWCSANTKSECYECMSWKRFMQTEKRTSRMSRLNQSSALRPIPKCAKKESQRSFSAGFATMRRPTALISLKPTKTKSLSIRQRILWERPVYTKRRTLSHVMKPAASM